MAGDAARQPGRRQGRWRRVQPHDRNLDTRDGLAAGDGDPQSGQRAKLSKEVKHANALWQQLGSCQPWWQNEEIIAVGKTGDREVPLTIDFDEEANEELIPYRLRSIPRDEEQPQHPTVLAFKYDAPGDATGRLLRVGDGQQRGHTEQRRCDDDDR